ncbi:MAG: DUF1343 domain-containing protein [Verrucomicrobiae bacterium]|nr:DUF1343 domain-containing protein [Verrucomicrobiae bacterium]
MNPPVVLPVDRLADLWPTELRGLRLGAVLHAASITSRCQPVVDVLGELDGTHFKLTTLFGPQHGFAGTTQDNMIEWEGYRHAQLGVPVYSLYGEHRQPTPEMLGNIDVLLVDLMDIGSRYYTFIWSLYLCMKACAAAGIHVVVCDRPNPINGVDCEGDVIQDGYFSFVGLHPIPVRHGKTIGELALQFQKEVFPDCLLTVLPMQHWERSMWFDQTGLPWAMPSPNMPTLDTAIVYPGMCLLEATNLSEGRGTTRPFETFGAPWIDGHALARALNALELPGVYFREIAFEPTFQKHARTICQGAFLHVTDRDTFRSLATTRTILTTIRDQYPEKFSWNPPPYEYEYEKLPIEILAGMPLAKAFPAS